MFAMPGSPTPVAAEDVRSPRNAVQVACPSKRSYPESHNDLSEFTLTCRVTGPPGASQQWNVWWPAATVSPTASSPAPANSMRECSLGGAPTGTIGAVGLGGRRHRARWNMPELKIADRLVGDAHPPLVVAEVGINHEGDPRKARRMVEDARAAGDECVKFQCHVIDDEMIPNAVVPGNASESIWDIMSRCALDEEEERCIKELVEAKGMTYLSTPFSRAAADRLDRMGVRAYKIGSGECNNYPLVRHIASFGKPVTLRTGMNDLAAIQPACCYPAAPTPASTPRPVS